MTVAEQIKKAHGPFDIERWFMAWRNKLVFTLTSYDSNQPGKTYMENSRLGVWDFKFIDGSRLVVRTYSK